VRGVRLSYVGEAGWEITCRASDAEVVFDAMRAAGAAPAGVFAQSAMRIEKRFLAYGHDLDTDVTPLEAGLNFAVAWDTDFVGRDALRARRETGPAERMVTVVLDDPAAVPLGNEPIYACGEMVGKTTSATFGYRIGSPVALGYLRADAAVEGARVKIDIARNMFVGVVTLSPAFDACGARMRSATMAI
jgi:glycine cleavage system aminomethyltransferase T